MIVVDASALVTALSDDAEEGHRVRGRLIGERLVAPELLDLEVASVLRRLSLAGRLGLDRAKQAIDDLISMRIERVSTAGC